jgi:cytochrome c peroxidase
MKKVFNWGSIWLAILSLTVVNCKDKNADNNSTKKPRKSAESKSKKGAYQTAKKHLDQFEPLPNAFKTEENPLTEDKIDLGRKLYYDKRLSKTQTVSCNSCHNLKEYGIDTRSGKKDNRKIAQTSEGIKNHFGPRNSPTVYNAAGQFRQFWDGRKADVEAQAKGPILNPVEMGMPEPDYVMKVVESIPGYRKAFEEAFPKSDTPVKIDNLAKAIGAFERKLVTPAPWDKFLEGDKNALTNKQIKGFNTFVSVGCTSCHTGTLVGGQMYQKLGLVKPWPNQKDKGRYKVTKNESDKMRFKVPILRNITETAPYFHDGSVYELDKAVSMMAKYQLGKDLSDNQTDNIVAWLESLKGEIPSDYIAKPELPEDGPSTPEPKPEGG